MPNERDLEMKVDRLNALWDELVLTGRANRPSTQEGLDDESSMVDRLQTAASIVAPQSIDRIRQRVFESGELPVPGAALPAPRQLHPHREVLGREPANKRSFRRNTMGQMMSYGLTAAMVLLLVGGFWFLNAERGWIGTSGDGDLPVLVPGQLASSPVAETAQGTVVPGELSSLTTSERRGVDWRLTPVGEPVTESLVATSDDTIYRLRLSHAFSGLEAIDAATGSVLWQENVEWSGASLAADEQGAYVIVGDQIVAFAADIGTKTVLMTLNSAPQQIILDRGSLLVWDGSLLEVLNATTGEREWAADKSTEDVNLDAVVPVPVVAGDSAVAVTTMGEIVRFDRATGEPTWTLEGYVPDQTRLLAVDEESLLVYGPRKDDEVNGANVRWLSSVDASTGTVNWESIVLTTSPGLEIVGGFGVLLADMNLAVAAMSDSERDSIEPILEEDRSSAPLHVQAIDLATGMMVFTDSHGLISNSGDPAFTQLASNQSGISILALSDDGRITVVSPADMTFTSIIDLGQPVSAIESGPGTVALLEDGSLALLDDAVLAGTGGVVAERNADADALTDWTLPLSIEGESFQGVADTVVARGIVYRSIETSNGRWVEAVYGSTGQLAWQQSVDWRSGQLVADRDGAYIVDRSNQLVALSSDTGTQRWSLPFGDLGITGIALGESLFAFDDANGLTAIDPVTGSVIWGHQIGEDGSQGGTDDISTEMMITGNLLLLLDNSGVLHAVEQESGEEIWSRPGFNPAATRMAWQEGVVFVLSSNELGSLLGVGLDMENGEELWTVGLSGKLYQPVATNETFFYLIADEVTTLSDTDLAYDPLENETDSASVQWPRSDAGALESKGGRLIFGLDAQSGEGIWTRSSNTAAFVRLGTTLLNSGGLHGMTNNGQVIWLARETGAIHGVADYVAEFGGVPLQIVESGSTESGSFATLEDGTLVNFGAQLFNRMG